MDWTFEVVVVPVASQTAVSTGPSPSTAINLASTSITDTRARGMRFAQLTPPGSGCSIVIGSRAAGMPPGSLKGLQLVVADAYRAREELLARGVQAGEIDVIDERDGGTLFGFADPDGNTWVVQQIKARADRPLLARLS